MAIWHLKQMERWKSLVSECLMSWLEKKIVLKCCLLLFYATTVNHFSIGLWRAMKSDFIWPLAKTNSVIALRSSKAFPKAKLAPEKCHNHCLVVCCPSDPLQLSESWRKHYIWEVCSANRWAAPKTAMPAASIDQQKGPSSSLQQCPTISHNQHFRSWMNWAGCFASSAWRLTNRHHFFKHLDNFLQGKHFHNQQEAENAFQEFFKFWSTDFYATRINKHFLFIKSVLVVMAPILINKDVFVPTYNDLKFTVQNRN